MRLRKSIPVLLAASFLLLASCLVPDRLAAADGDVSLSGRITDETGAAIPQAVVRLKGNKAKRRETADELGRYRFDRLAPGSYSLTASAPGYVLAEPRRVELTLGDDLTVDLTLRVSFRRQQVTVETEADWSKLDLDTPIGTQIIQGDELDELPDDPDELRAYLQELAGPDGAGVMVDGFSDEEMPAKEDIREIRIEEDDYSAEYDSPGAGGIQIITRAGRDKFRGRASFRFGDESLNSRSPFAENRAPYQRRNFHGSLGGPLAQNTSFYVSVSRFENDRNAVVHATVLDREFNPTPFNRAVPTAGRSTSVRPRIDHQLNENHTLSARYSYHRGNSQDAGIGRFSLPEVGYDTVSESHNARFSETAVLSETTINETRLAFRRSESRNLGDITVPTVTVLEAFRGGGSQVGRTFNRRDSWELQNYTTRTHKAHTVQFGARLRALDIDNFSPRNFGGAFTFAGGFGPQLDAFDQPVLDAMGQPVTVQLTSLERYRRTLLFQRQGFGAARIRELGGGATQFQIAGGNPAIGVSQMDLGIFALDDWRLAPNFNISFGLRYETQTNISNWANLAPRLGFAWSPDNAKKRNTVVRGGFGIFYTRVAHSYTLDERRFDGVRQQQYIVREPDFFPQVPSTDALEVASLPQTVRQLDERARAPYLIQSSLAIERQLPWKTSVSATYTHRREVNLLRSRSLNSPDPATGERLLGPNNIFRYETNGSSRQHELSGYFRTRFRRGVSLFGYYVLGKAWSDTDGAGSFPANPFDWRADWGRSSMDVRHRFVMGGSLTAPGGFRLRPMVTASSGAPFNITTGEDLNGDLQFVDRPAFASDLTAPGVVMTPLGAFDPTPGPGDRIVPRNFGTGPGRMNVNLSLSKTVRFGGARHKGSSDAGATAGDASGAEGGSKQRSERAYRVTFSASARNLLNTTNPGAPIGNLLSPFFGQSISSARASSAGNRVITLGLRFGF